ncbi:MAG: FeoB-associated Cys-rich membrane protein [Clostridia bacterium]|nr:FeoB-associated Cys-rich membrane protein [Clostridia bacterium]
MQPVEIIVIVAAAAIVIGVVVAAIIRKKKGISSCDCDCAHCKGCGVKPEKKS